MRQVDYYTQTEAEDAMSVVAGWIGQNRDVKVKYHNGSAVDANIKTGVLRIPKMACASGITHDALMLLRSRVYHEAGHIDETDVDKPAGALGEILNALEDRRMEASEAKKHKGCEVVFRWANDWYNKDIASEAIKGNVNAPLWEALCAMGFMSEGLQPLWPLSKKAQAYVDAAYEEFAKVALCDNTSDCLELAKKVLALLKDANEQYKKENPNPQQPQKGEGKPEKGEGKPQKSDGEPQAGGQGDLDEEGEDPQDGEGEPGEDGDEKEGKSGKSKKDDKDDKDDSDSKGGKGDKDDKDSDDKDGSGKDDSKDDSKKDSKKDEGKADTEDGAEGEDEEDEGKEEGGGGSDTKDGDDEGEDGESGGSAGAGDSDDSDGEEDENADGKKEDGPDADAPYTPDDSRRGEDTTGDGTEEPDEWKDTDLDDELEGRSKEDAINEAVEEFFDDMDPADADYLSRRDLDGHRVPPTRDMDKATFKKDREQVAVMAASMTRALEQALRSLCRCRRDGYKQQGRLDHKRLVAISKGLSKEIFFKIKDGQKMECAVEIIIDESGSMGNYHDVRLLAIAIGEALDAIKVPFEITGTTTKYGMGDYQCPPLDGMTRTNPIMYNHYVMFGEKWQAVRHRLVHTGSHVHNIDGEAIEYCVFRLHQRPERRKVVFSLSDGEPCGGQGTDSNLGRNITRVCQKARKAGVEVYGFGIGTQAPMKYYGKKFFVFLQNATTMSQTFIRKFADVVTGGQVRI